MFRQARTTRTTAGSAISTSCSPARLSPETQTHRASADRDVLLEQGHEAVTSRSPRHIAGSRVAQVTRRHDAHDRRAIPSRGAARSGRGRGRSRRAASAATRRRRSFAGASDARASSPAPRGSGIASGPRRPFRPPERGAGALGRSRRPSTREGASARESARDRRGEMAELFACR